MFAKMCYIIYIMKHNWKHISSHSINLQHANF